MDSKLTDSSCSGFAAALAAKQSVPGGGGAAALAGALAASLCSMAGEFTVGKKRYAEHEADVRRMLAEAERSRQRLLELVDEDAEGFAPLSRAYALPKEDPSRAAIIEERTKRACEAPLRMMEETCRVIDLLAEMGQKGSRLLLSDVGCGAYLARGALEAASLNVYANTKSLADREFALATDARCGRMLDEYAPKAEAVGRSATDQIRKRC